MDEMALRDIEILIVRAIHESVYPFVEFVLKANTLAKLREMVRRWATASECSLGYPVALFYDPPRTSSSLHRAFFQVWEPTSRLQFEHYATSSPLYDEYKDVCRRAYRAMATATRRAHQRRSPTARLEFDGGDLRFNFYSCEMHRRIAISLGFDYIETVRMGKTYILQWLV